MLKADLRARYDFLPSAAFSTVDSLRDGALNNRNIAYFLKLNGFYATENEVVAIIRRLDIDADSQITYEEFAEALKPCSFWQPEERES